MSIKARRTKHSVNRAGELITIKYKSLDLSKFDFLTPEHGKFRFDLTRECVRGAEILWSSSNFARGFIILLLDEKFDLLPILERCVNILFYKTPNMGESSAAIKLAKKAINESQIAVTFSASNGIQWMQILHPNLCVSVY